MVVCGSWGARTGSHITDTDASAGASEPITDDFRQKSRNWSFGKIKRLKCARVKNDIVTVSTLSYFF